MSYVQLWNTHSIRKQKDRPNAVTGKPAVLYYYTPDVVRYGRPINESLVNEFVRSTAMGEVGTIRATGCPGTQE